MKSLCLILFLYLNLLSGDVCHSATYERQLVIPIGSYVSLSFPFPPDKVSQGDIQISKPAWFGPESWNATHVVLTGIPSYSDWGNEQLVSVRIGHSTNVAKISVSLLPFYSSSSISPVYSSLPTSCSSKDSKTVASLVIGSENDAEYTMQAKTKLIETLAFELAIDKTRLHLLHLNQFGVLPDTDVLVSKTINTLMNQNHNNLMVTWLLGCGVVEKPYMHVLSRLESLPYVNELSQKIKSKLISWYVISTTHPFLSLYESALPNGALPRQARHRLTKRNLDDFLPPEGSGDEPTQDPMTTVVPEKTWHSTPTPRRNVPEFTTTQRAVFGMTTRLDAPGPAWPTFRYTSKPMTPTPSIESNGPQIRDGLSLGPYLFRVGEFLKIVIPDNVIYDKQDGGLRNLRLKFAEVRYGITQDLSPNSWVKLYDDPYTGEKSLQGLPRTGHRGTHKYRFIAMDRDGNAIRSDITIIVQEIDNRKKLSLSHSFEFTLELGYLPFISDMFKQIDVLTKISNALSVSPSELLVLGVSEGSVKLNVSVKNLISSGYYCPTTEIRKLIDKIANNYRLSEQFLLVLSPYVVSKVRVTPLNNVCRFDTAFPRLELRATDPAEAIAPSKVGERRRTTKPFGVLPSRNKGRPKLRRKLEPFLFRMGQYESLRLGNGLFKDSKDGNLSKLKLKLLEFDKNNVTRDVNRGTWIDVHTNQVDGRKFLIGIARREHIGIHRFRLLVIDSDGNAATADIKVIVEEVPSIVFKQLTHELTLRVNYDYMKFLYSLDMQIALLEKLHDWLGGSMEDLLILGIAQSNSFDIRLSRKHFVVDNGICPTHELWQMVEEKLASNDEYKKYEISQSFREALLPFNLTAISLKALNKPCATDRSFPTQYLGLSPIDTAAVTPPEKAETLPWVIIVISIVAGLACILIVALGMCCCLSRKSGNKRQRHHRTSSEKADQYLNKHPPVIFADEIEDRPPSHPLIVENDGPPFLASPLPLQMQNGYKHSASSGSDSTTPLTGAAPRSLPRPYDRFVGYENSHAASSPQQNTLPFTPPPRVLVSEHASSYHNPNAFPVPRKSPPHVPP